MSTIPRGRRVRVRGYDISDIHDRHAQIKARLIRSAKYNIDSREFDRTSYTDAIMMLVETDITIAYRMMGQEKLFASDPRYHEIIWTYFAPRFIDETYIDALQDNPQGTFATMMDAVTKLGGIPASELYKAIMSDDHMFYCGVKGTFQRMRVPGENRYVKTFVVENVDSLEALYEASTKLCCVAVDAYVVNYLNDWAELSYGPPYNCMNVYLQRHGLLNAFSYGEEKDMYEGMYDWDATDIIDPAAITAEAVRFSNTPVGQPATIDRNDDNPNWRTAGINRLLP
jgi:hypothetical protein